MWWCATSRRCRDRTIAWVFREVVSGAIEAAHGRAKEDVVRVCGWLEEALAFLGAGAKTASGYGRFAAAP